jgi:general secretion pathway protein A
MILSFYNLREQPFGVTPDPRYLYLSPTHREALASVRYGFNADRGFTALIAKPGMGKTTLLFDFLGGLQSHAKTVFLFQWQSSPQELLRNLLFDLGIEDDGSDMVRMHRTLNELLLKEHKEGRRLVVVVDEAQNLDDSVLEMLRMLSNFETSREKLMHLILAGQPQLADKLASPRLTQLRQRISIFARLKPLNPAEIKLYIDHRLSVAGYDLSMPLFTERAQALIANETAGIPRQINNVCFNALSLGCANKQRTIDADVIHEVLDDLDLGPVCSEGATPSRLPEPKVAATKLLAPTLPAAARAIRSRVPVDLLKWSLWAAVAVTLLTLITWPLARKNPQVAGASAVVSQPHNTETAPSSEFTPTKSETGQGASPDAATTPPMPEYRIIRSVPGDTLYEICLKEFGKYDAGILAKMREENPWLTNPAQIPSGKEIRIPSQESITQAIHGSDDRVRDAYDVESEKP